MRNFEAVANSINLINKCGEEKNDILIIGVVIKIIL